MPGDTKYKQMGKQIVNYANAVLAMDVLNKKTANQTISIETAQGVIDYQNSKPDPKFIDVINDLLNRETEVIKPGENFVVTVGANAYEVKVSDLADGVRELNIEKHLVQSSEGTFVLSEMPFPKVNIKLGSDSVEPKFSVTIDGKEVFNERAPYPGPVQRETIALYGKKVVEGDPQQLAIMGTGTGKSWVLAGITHATGFGIIVVPDMALANEMKKDAISVLHGRNIGDQVRFSTEFDSVEAFEAALLTTKQMILIADDPLFHEKAGLVKDKVVLMDESHQHTFKPESIRTLQDITANNALLAVTGTPTTKLKDILCPDGPAMVDVNVRQVMDNGGLRQNYRQTDTNVPATHLVTKAVQGYFGRDEYLTRGPGVISVDDIKKQISQGNPESAVIDRAIAQNRERGMAQKNFVFTGDKVLREQIMTAYDQIANGTYPDVQVLEREIQASRRQAEINARADIIHELHPEQSLISIKLNLEQTTPMGPRVNLKNEVQDAQKQQVAAAVNTQALTLIYPKLKERDIEIMLRTGKMNEYINNPDNVRQTPSIDAIGKMFPGLTGAQGDAFRDKVKEVAVRMSSEGATASHLCTKREINLEHMNAKYSASASVKTNTADSSEMLDQLRTGLVMHVASDSKFATGISITSVLGVQQVVSSTADSLNNPVDAPQLHGRNIRANDRGAFNQQVVAAGVKEGEYVALDDIYDKESGLKMDTFFVHEKAVDQHKEKFMSIKERFAAAKDDSTPAPDESYRVKL